MTRAYEPGRDIELFLRAFFRYGWMLLIASVYLGVQAYLLSDFQEKTYRASVRLLVAQPTAFSGGLLGTTLPTTPPLDAQAYREAAYGGIVLKDALEAAQEKADFEAIESFRRSSGVQVTEGSQSIIITMNVRDADQNRAADLANAWAQSLKIWEDERVRESYRNYRQALESQQNTIAGSRTTSTGEELEVLESLEGVVERDLDLILALETGATGQLDVLDEASVPTEAITPRPLVAAVLATIVGLVLSILIIFFRESLVKSIRTPNEASRLTNLSIIAEFPKNAGQRLKAHLASYLRAKINHELPETEPKIIAVISPDLRQAKTDVAVTLAENYARANKRTLLLDMDFYNPSLYQRFQLEAETSESKDLVSLVEGFSMSSLTVKKIETNLHLLGSVSASSRLEHLDEHFQTFLEHLIASREWDTFIIDAPPIAVSADALVLSPLVSGVVVCVGENQTQRRYLTDSLDFLNRMGAHILGLVITNRPARKARFGFNRVQAESLW